MEKLTRHQAAKKLGGSEATISNYYAAGLIGGCRGKGNILYLSAYDVERYRARIKMISADENRLIQKHKELEHEIARAEKEVQELRHGVLFGKKRAEATYMCHLIQNLYKALMVPGLKKREVDVVCQFIEGAGLNDIACYFGLTKERVRQILGKAVERFADTVSITRDIRDNMNLEIENEALRKENERLRLTIAKNDGYVMSDYLKTLLDTRCVDYDLSVRSLNVLKNFRNNDRTCEWYPIGTIGELIICPGGKEGLMKQQNCGRKTFEEICSLVCSLGLVFKYRDEKLEDFYRRLEKMIEERRRNKD